MVDRYDSERFGRLGHEVPRGAEPKESRGPVEGISLDYQEEGGIFLIEEFDKDNSVVISDRDR